MIELLFSSVIARFIRSGNLEIALPSGRSLALGDGTGEKIGIRIVDKRALWRLILHPTLALGELFVDDRIQVSKGSVYGFLDIISRNIGWGAPSFLPLYSQRRRLLLWLQKSNDPKRSTQNVGHHYDLDGRLYRLFLDSDQQYSCAYFESDGADIEEAQLAKKRHIAAKLRLTPNQRVLDIGCGWGGMALYLARCCQAHVTGITLSKEQLEASRHRSKAQGLEKRIEFRFQDYRDVTERFDRIVSVGMFEHVGLPDYDKFFSHARELLADNGVMLLHTIGRLDGPSPTNAWIKRYIFPGSYVPALSEIMPAVERAGLVMTDIEVLRIHYAETLKAWRERFNARRAEAAKLYDERFCRLWEFYLAACETGFRHGGLVIFQLQLARRIDAVPLTRNYIELAEAALREAEGRAQISVAEAAE